MLAVEDEQLKDNQSMVGPEGRVDIYMPAGSKASGPLQKEFDDPLSNIWRQPLVEPPGAGLAPPSHSLGQTGAWWG
jgi:hypothetical protein